LGSGIVKDQPTRAPDGSAPLPRPRSFVVQLAADASPPGGAIRGRAVHIVSGDAAYFESMTELLGFLGVSIARHERDG
jgi:hypothetical protein